MWLAESVRELFIWVTLHDLTINASMNNSRARADHPIRNNNLYSLYYTQTSQQVRNNTLHIYIYKLAAKS